MNSQTLIGPERWRLAGCPLDHIGTFCVPIVGAGYALDWFLRC